MRARGLCLRIGTQPYMVSRSLINPRLNRQSLGTSNESGRVGAIFAVLLDFIRGQCYAFMRFKRLVTIIVAASDWAVWVLTV